MLFFWREEWLEKVRQESTVTEQIEIRQTKMCNLPGLNEEKTEILVMLLEHIEAIDRLQFGFLFDQNSLLKSGMNSTRGKGLFRLPVINF